MSARVKNWKKLKNKKVNSQVKIHRLNRVIKNHKFKQKTHSHLKVKNKKLTKNKIIISNK